MAADLVAYRGFTGLVYVCILLFMRFLCVPKIPIAASFKISSEIVPRTPRFLRFESGGTRCVRDYLLKLVVPAHVSAPRAQTILPWASCACCYRLSCSPENLARPSGVHVDHPQNNCSNTWALAYSTYDLAILGYDTSSLWYRAYRDRIRR